MESKKKILIVDDVKAVHLLYRQALKDCNYDILDAERGSEALSLILKNNIDLLILDLNLPDMDGTELMEKLREKNRDIPVIVLTAYGLKEKVIKTAGFGIDYYLLKPVDLNLFRDRVKQTLLAYDEEKVMRLKRSSREFLSELSSFENETSGEEIVSLKKQIIELSEKISELEENKKENTESEYYVDESISILNQINGNKTEVESKIESKTENIDFENAGKIKCPVCSATFFPYEYESYKNFDIDPDDIMYELYLELRNKYDLITVCPECLYSEEKSTFFDIPEREKERVIKRKVIRKEIIGNKDFRYSRTYDLEMASYLTAGNCYEARYKNNWYIGNLYVRAALFAKTQGNGYDEVKMLEHAARYYEDAFVMWEEEYGKYIRIQLIYFLVLISIKLKRYEKALMCIDSIRKARELQAYPAIEEAVNEKNKIIEEMRKK